ncbi:barstar family protein [Accumulibacter sp.]|uniref:Barstar family protein n=1 Tax=Candidatus Accumulibacter proximus TaxID=2954385 RepID=A0A935PX51_9PROT|nr:barstar family protein [Accumulibacter sp.]MBK7674322.1 barstar family protein [Candidatus Accumulibacter proximus]MBL8376046.1 barstar family protein [Accumulibacter sp.]
MRQNELVKLLLNAPQAGIYQLPQRSQAAVRRAAESAGCACFDVSFAESERIDSALSRIGYALDFPEWYGENCDALKDCLTDFSWREAAGYVLFISGAENLRAENPAAFKTLNDVFATAIEEWRMHDFAMWVFYDFCADGLAVFPRLA